MLRSNPIPGQPRASHGLVHKSRETCPRKRGYVNKDATLIHELRAASPRAASFFAAVGRIGAEPPRSDATATSAVRRSASPREFAPAGWGHSNGRCNARRSAYRRRRDNGQAGRARTAADSRTRRKAAGGRDAGDNRCRSWRQRSAFRGRGGDLASCSLWPWLLVALYPALKPWKNQRQLFRAERGIYVTGECRPDPSLTLGMTNVQVSTKPFYSCLALR